MPHRPFSNDALDALRKVGDPELEMHEDEDPARYFAEVAANGLLAALDASSLTKVVLDAAQEGAHEAVNRLKSYGVDPNPAIQRAHDRFAYYGDEICAALLLAALPATYATAWGSRVLVAHGDLVWALPRRVRETAIFLTTVMANGRTADGENDDPVATIVRTSAALRLFHHMVRAQLEQDEEAMHAIRAGVGRAGDKPINQEDLLGTLLTFSVTTFDALDQFGVHWDDEDREAYLVCWDVIGGALGIGTRAVRAELKPKPPWIRPQTVGEATLLLDQLQQRQWLPVQATIEKGRPFPWSDLVPGRVLVDALLAALTDAMPAPKMTWPAVVMRELAPMPVQARLGLQRSGMSSYTARWLAKRSRHANLARAVGLRVMATDVTRHAMESFLRAGGPPFEIPGLDLRELRPSDSGAARLELRPRSASTTSGRPPRPRRRTGRAPAS